MSSITSGSKPRPLSFPDKNADSIAFTDLRKTVSSHGIRWENLRYQRTCLPSSEVRLDPFQPCLDGLLRVEVRLLTELSPPQRINAVHLIREVHNVLGAQHESDRPLLEQGLKSYAQKN